MKTILISFADSRYKASLELLKRNTESFDFDERFFLQEKDLPADFMKKMDPFKYRRGFGYWYWKAYLVEKYLRRLSDGDILVYSDAGNYWNHSGLKRFNEYIHILVNSKSDILAFQQPFLEKDYTKGDLLDYFNVYNNPEVTLSYQYWGGAFILQKSQQTINMVTKWLDIFKNHFELATDKRSIKPNLWGFIENRHDQSIFSLLVKTMPHVEISYMEVSSLDNSFTGMNEYPILGKRVRNNVRTKLQVVKYGFSFPIRYFQGWKLKHFENFVFKDNKLWW